MLKLSNFFACRYGTTTVDLQGEGFVLFDHTKHNDWLSHLEGDERNGAHENVYQGEMLLVYRISEKTRAYTGVQHSSRKESFEAEDIRNTNVGIGMQTEF